MKSATGSTPATMLLEKEGLSFELHAHDYDPDAARKGLQAAEALGAPPAQVFKTLLVKVDKERPACVIIPSDRKLTFKTVASALGGKSASMMPPPDAERMTGYKTGGISPFGQKKTVPIVLDASAMEQSRIYVNAGRRGLQCSIDPNAAASHFGWTVAPVSE
ncbi:Cys-tRNA(Pro) deacylase [Gluconobacter oxydans]|uniref:Cys-tRNA(Pro) deacylase n=1 Tax=Gluconobacter oxydans TaxID=442 RepID=UPI0039EA7176